MFKFHDTATQMPPSGARTFGSFTGNTGTTRRDLKPIT